MRVDMGDGGSRCSVCYATYGYMGDLLRASKALRWSRCAASEEGKRVSARAALPLFCCL